MTTAKFPSIRDRFVNNFSGAYIALFLILLFAVNLNYGLSALLMPGYISYDVKHVSELSFLIAIALTLMLSRQQRVLWLACFMSLPEIARLLLAIILIIGLASTYMAQISSIAMLEVTVYMLLFC